MSNALEIAQSPITQWVTFSLEDETYGIDVTQIALLSVDVSDRKFDVLQYIQVNIFERHGYPFLVGPDTRYLHGSHLSSKRVDRSRSASLTSPSLCVACHNSFILQKVSNKSDQFPLSIRIPFNIALSGIQARVTG